MGFIYKITNTINGKCYIGETTEKNPLRRWENHKYAIKTGRGCPALRNAFKAHGEENFTFEIVRECKDEHIIAIEEYYIEQYDSLVPNGYNLSPGGQQGGTFAGHKHSNETKQKQADRIRDLYHNSTVFDNFKANISIIKKIVSSYDLNGKLVKIYDCIIDAAKENNITDGAIHNCLSNRRKQVAGFIWRYGNKNEIISPFINGCNNSKNKMKPVIQYDINNNKIKEFISINNASIQTNISRSSINQMLSGRTKTAGGFIWKYKE